MKILLPIFIAILLLAGNVPVYAQAAKDKQPAITAEEAIIKFPGFSREQMDSLIRTKKQYRIPLPTWIPEGFRVVRMIVKIDKKIKPEDQDLAIIYSKDLPDGKKQCFGIDAGIDGIGDLMYDPSDSFNTKVGRIYLCYQPVEDGKKLKKYARTDWFECNGVAYAYGSYEGMHGEIKNQVMISHEDTRKIIRSIQKL